MEENENRAGNSLWSDKGKQRVYPFLLSKPFTQLQRQIEMVVTNIAAACKKLSASSGIIVMPGVELTHTPIKDMAELVSQARSLGARLVLVHGETLSEPVAAGTNKKALQCDIDILAHPGLITQEEARLAAKKGILLEITTRCSHAYSNGHVVKMAKLAGARLVLNSDSHAPTDLMPPAAAEIIAQGAGLSKQDIAVMRKNACSIVAKLS